MRISFFSNEIVINYLSPPDEDTVPAHLRFIYILAIRGSSPLIAPYRLAKTPARIAGTQEPLRDYFLLPSSSFINHYGGIPKSQVSIRIRKGCEDSAGIKGGYQHRKLPGRSQCGDR